MGNTHIRVRSRPSTAAEKRQRQQRVIDDTVQSIHQAERVRRAQRRASPRDRLAEQMLDHMVAVRTQQVQRGAAEFVKVDYIGIAAKLVPGANPLQLDALTVPELRLLIRKHVFGEPDADGPQHAAVSVTDTPGHTPASITDAPGHTTASLMDGPAHTPACITAHPSVGQDLAIYSAPQ